MIRFAINRTCKPNASLDEFIELAKAAEVSAVEIRNDIEGREFADGTPASVVREKLSQAGLGIASVNALQRFNEWNDARAKEAESLIAYTAALGAPGLVLCPVHSEGHGWSEKDAERNIRDGLKKLKPILQAHGVIGYVEPLGMRNSTMKKQAVSVAAISDIDGWDAYQLCYDTFQFFRCHDEKLFPEHIGLTHISGISRMDLAPEDLTEPERILISPGDRVENIQQLKKLIAFGYQGFISMEPFNPEVQSLPNLQSMLKDSLKFVHASL